MNRRIFFILLMWGGIASLAVAQDTAEKPTSPYLAKLPAQACWRMDFTALNLPPATSTVAAAAGGQPGAPRSLTEKQWLITRSGKLRQDLAIWSDGSKTEMWTVDRVVFIKPSRSPNFISQLMVETPYPHGFPDFMELTWVDLAHFKGTEVKNGLKCFVYYSPSRPPVYPSGIPLGPATVWISAETKLPVILEDGSSRAIYTFNLPVAQLALPQECQAMLDEFIAFSKRMAGQRMVLPP